MCIEGTVLEDTSTRLQEAATHSDPEVQRLARASKIVIDYWHRQLTSIANGCADPAFIARRALTLIPSEISRHLSNDQIELLREDLRRSVGAGDTRGSTGA